MFGLPDKTINLINEIFAKYPEIEKVLISGLIDDLPIPYMCDLSILKKH